MNDMSKKVGYLKGLLESMPLDENSTSDKLLKGIVDLLGDLNERADIVDELLDDLNDYVESIDDDLSALEGEAPADGSPFHFFGNDEENEDEDYDDDFDNAEDHLHILRPETPVEPEADALAGGLCPECMRMFFVSLNDPEDAFYDCPHCGKRIQPLALTPENTPIAKLSLDQ